jgi:hypothetical protein
MEFKLALHEAVLPFAVAAHLATVGHVAETGQRGTAVWCADRDDFVDA